MAFAQRIITSNSAGDQEFTFTFPFIKEEHIKVFVNFVEKNQGTASSEFQVITNTTPNKIRLGTGLSANNTRVEIRRVSSINTVLVDFEDGSTLTAADLDTNSKQSLFIAQELDDAQKQGLSIDLTTGVPTLNSQRLSGVSDPINAQDAVTKNFLERTGSITSTQILNGTIVNDDINANADIAVSKLDHGTARQILQTNAAGNNVEFTSNVDIPGTLDVTGNVDLDANLNVDGATTLDATTVDGTLTATSVSVGGLTISHTIDNGSPHRSVLLHDATDDLRLQIARNQMIFERSDGVNFISLTHSTDANDPEINGRVNISHAGHGVKITTKTDGIKVTGKVDLDSITGTGVVTSGTSTSDTQVYSSKRAGEIFYQKDTLSEIQSGETWSSDDQKVATTAAIDARIIDLVDDVGGFVPIANETSFPNANPDVNNGAGTLVSVPLANNLTSNSSGVISIANGTVGNSTVTITGATASSTFAQGFGIIVETTSTLNTYTFHRYVPKATEVTTVATNITDVNTVAGEISPTNNISAVASVANNLSAFDATFRGQVTAVANDSVDIGLVAGKVTEIGRLGTIEAVADMAILGTTDVVADMAILATNDVVNDLNILGTADVVHDMNVLATATNVNDINLVAGSISNVNNVGNNINSVANVDASLSNVNTVSTNINSVNNVNTNINHVTTVSGISGNVSTVAGISNHVTTVAQDATDIGNVATSISDVNTTAANIANVNAVGSNINNVNTVATNLTPINTAATYLNDFQALYLGAASSAPVQDSVGNPVNEGDLYFNSGNKQLQVYNGNVFTSIFDTALDFAKLATAAFNALYTASAGSNSIDLGGLAITGAAFSNEAVATNRVSLTKGSGTFNLGGI